ncbi:chemotaxis protein CheB [Desertivirga arenae]|uniref:chemotaxis protein CheB n=1 Tax=Desertivirga arenae TaxID=2810309 RepID=UPI001A965517|nr:chemotaxis protein CheB [Pedobacter sp. SYSU D00823]
MEKPLLVIGIGASAGGLKALTDFFQHVDTSTGVAFVIIQHLYVHARSRLDYFMSRTTKMKVCRVDAPTKVEANKVYVLPEGKMMVIQKGVLYLRDRGNEEVINRAVDIFFKSLAEDCKERAIGIILSGTGTDGLEGAKAIEDKGGRILVQDPATTRFNSMPSQIVNRNHPTLILPPAELAESLNWHLEQLTAT